MIERRVDALSLTLFVLMICVALAPKPAQAKISIHDFAQCLVDFDAARMRDWVQWDGPGLIYKEVGAIAPRANCHADAKWEYWALRGALAEALLMQKFDPVSIPDFSNAPPVTDIDMALAWGNNDGRRSMLLNVYSECLVRGSSRMIFRILTTKYGSEDERIAFGALKTDDDECRKLAGGLRPNGSNAVLRARLALALFRMVENAD
ncbi:MAG: hypothetical protein ABW184_06435 [Sphingobium sp.]